MDKYNIEDMKKAGLKNFKEMAMAFMFFEEKNNIKYPEAEKMAMLAFADYLDKFTIKDLIQ